MRISRRTLPTIASALLVTLLTAGCGSRQVPDTLDDTTITTRVKTAMLNDREVGARSIDVATAAGVVTLTGRVRNETERNQALSLARRIPGVVDVKDSLQVE